MERRDVTITASGDQLTDVRLKRRIYNANDEYHDAEGYVLKLDFEDTQPVNMMYLPEAVTGPRIDPNRVPPWCRKEKARDKRMWRQLHYTVKTSNVYGGPFFEKIPEVQAYVPKSKRNEENSVEQK